MEDESFYIISEKYGFCAQHPQVEAVRARFGSAGVAKFELPPQRQAEFLAQHSIEVYLDTSRTMDYADAEANLMFLRCFAGADKYGYACVCYYRRVNDREMLRLQMTRWALVPAAATADRPFA